ncbi:ladderlectin-like, partial [Nematolebias whitei]|uniref:ladderlectin-like n=1 Tax=Nematolebias whitei TaxID=451745 RepID=UPI00189C4AC5
FTFVNNPMSWYKAEEHCNGLGGHLASATSPREYSFLQQMTQTAGQSIAWLGGFNLQGQWMWIDREGFYYTNWYSQSSTSSNSCLYLHSACGWRNTPCSSAYRFICSKNAFGC